jgi:hypothetical protein
LPRRWLCSVACGGARRRPRAHRRHVGDAVLDLRCPAVARFDRSDDLLELLRAGPAAGDVGDVVVALGLRDLALACVLSRFGADNVLTLKLARTKFGRRPMVVEVLRLQE